MCSRVSPKKRGNLVPLALEYNIQTLLRVVGAQNENVAIVFHQQRNTIYLQVNLYKTYQMGKIGFGFFPSA